MEKIIEGISYKCFICKKDLLPNKIIKGWESLYDQTYEGLFCNEHYKEAREREFMKYPDIRPYMLK